MYKTKMTQHISRKRQMSLKSDVPTGTDSNVLMYHSQHMYHLDSPHHNGGVMETPCAVDRKELPSQTAAQAEASQNAIPLVSTGEEIGEP